MLRITLGVLFLALSTQGHAETLINTEKLVQAEGLVNLVSINYGQEQNWVKLKERVMPNYPKPLARYGNHGMVMLKVKLNADASEILQIDTVASDHPLFEREAVRAMLKSQFTWSGPESNTEPVQVFAPMRFIIAESQGSVIPGMSVKPFTFPKKSSSKLPEDLQYDVAPEVLIAAAPIYPFELLQKKVTGEATISAVVDPEGNIQQVKILKSSHEAFGLSAKAMMEAWKLKPAQRNKQATWTVFSMVKKFDLGDRDVDLSEQSKLILEQWKKGKEKFYTLSELDHIPKALYRPQPVFPPALAPVERNYDEGKVMVKFFVDEQGMVHLPQIVSSQQNDLAWAALTAVGRWQFEPPTVNKVPVKAILQLPISFTRPAPEVNDELLRAIATIADEGLSPRQLGRNNAEAPAVPEAAPEAPLVELLP